MLNGLIELSGWGYVAVTLALTHITILSVTLYLHRSQAHRAVAFHPAVNHFFRFWLWLTTGMVTREWVAVHRKHHAEVETAADPHSPQIKGIKAVLWRGAELYRAAIKKPEITEKYGHGTPDDWLENRLYSRHSEWGLAAMLIIDLALFGVIGVTIWAVQMIWIPFFAAGVVNGLGHWFGYRNFEPADASTNILPVGILIGGEELHNNHHAFAASARFSSRSWEFDLGWLYIRLLRRLGLARVKRLAPQPRFNHAKPLIDYDTVSAVITNRLHVMSDYAREVTGGVYKDEMRKANVCGRRFLRKGKKLLARADNLLDRQAEERLQKLLAESDALKVVYEYRQRLQSIWQQKSATKESLVMNLQKWCLEAEQTGITALQEFAQGLRRYTLQAA